MYKDKKDAYYFSHDSNARNDIKILRLRRSLGLEGYGIYFCLIEMLREQDDYKMSMASIPDIAFELHTSDEKVKTVICAFNLFEIDEEHFFSARLVRSMEEYKSLKTKLSEAGRKGGLSKAKAGLNQGQSNPLALKEIKGKEKKENKNKIELDFSFCNEKLVEDLKAFVEFRKSIKKAFATQDQIQRFYKKLLSLSDNNEEIAKAIIDRSIVNGWQGIFELPKEQIPTPPKKEVEEIPASYIFNDVQIDYGSYPKD